MVDVLMLCGPRLLVSAELRRRFADAGVRVEVRNTEPVEDRTLSVSELALCNVVTARPQPAPPWQNDQPWLKRKKKGRS